ncbi:MAG: hypothetical protein ACR2IE_05150 [Candidatus Sumerlaeaceae bacterium]
MIPGLGVTVTWAAVPSGKDVIEQLKISLVCPIEQRDLFRRRKQAASGESAPMIASMESS